MESTFTNAPGNCPYCGVGFPPRGKGAHLLKCRQNPPRFKCGLCNLGFETLERLQHHQFYCENNRPRAGTCDGCGRTFPSQTKLKAHEERCPRLKEKQQTQTPPTAPLALRTSSTTKDHTAQELKPNTSGRPTHPQSSTNSNPMVFPSMALASPAASPGPKGLPPALGWSYCAKSPEDTSSNAAPIKRLPPGLPIPNNARNGSVLHTLTPRGADPFQERSSLSPERSRPAQQRPIQDPEKLKLHQRSPSKHILDSVAQIDDHFGAFQAGIDRLENSLAGFKLETSVEIVGLRTELLLVRKEIREVIKGVQQEQQNGIPGEREEPEHRFPR
ncbi:hypothetical protein MMC10_008087 [Thelotrema lepadinum]|nr:hypothetical protein [Thelotrema lepadinum]